MRSSSPRLWVVATPLGNLGDMTDRGREVLEHAGVIMAEDTRRTGMLLTKLGITARRLVSCHEHNEAKRVAMVAEYVENGEHAALVSDAGTPLMSDPGYRVVRGVRELGVEVSPVPGASAPVAALSACGLPPYPFTFLGFLPHRSAEKQRTLAEFGSVRTTLVFFERKNRVRETLSLALEALGNREACVARELTKAHEEFILLNLEDWETVPEDLLGEITIVIGPPPSDLNSSESDVRAVLVEELELGGKPKEVVRRAKTRIAGWSGKDLYDFLQNMS